MCLEKTHNKKKIYKKMKKKSVKYFSLMHYLLCLICHLDLIIRLTHGSK